MNFRPISSILRKVYCDLVAAQIRRALFEGVRFPEADGMVVDQHQSNGLHCIHQLRVKLPGDMGTYRILVATPETPITIGGVPVDQHFIEPLLPPKDNVVRIKAAAE